MPKQSVFSRFHSILQPRFYVPTQGRTYHLRGPGQMKRRRSNKGKGVLRRKGNVLRMVPYTIQSVSFCFPVSVSLPEVFVFAKQCPSK